MWEMRNRNAINFNKRLIGLIAFFIKLNNKLNFCFKNYL